MYNIKNTFKFLFSECHLLLASISEMLTGIFTVHTDSDKKKSLHGH